MERNIDINEITDGKRYGLNDLVRVGCNDCAGCFACCQGMGGSIVIDPYDCYRLTKGLNQSFEVLLQEKLELNVVDGVILPNLKMQSGSDACAFLNEEGRCSIHPHRPGICRIFPLGRLYEDDGFDYVLQVHECKKENKTKVKVQKWIDTPDAKENEAFILSWHRFIKRVQKYMKTTSNEQTAKQLSLFILNLFFVKPYDTERSFYVQFEERMKQAEGILALDDSVSN